jgi:hypothetical protein
MTNKFLFILAIMTGFIMPSYANEIYLTCKSTKSKSLIKQTHLGTYNPNTGFYEEEKDIEENQSYVLNVFLNREINVASIDGKKGEINFSEDFIAIRIPPGKKGEIKNMKINRSDLKFIYFSYYPLGELNGISSNRIINATGKCTKSKKVKGSAI